MKSISIFFFIIISTNSYSQLINLKTNLSGKYIVTCNETIEELIEITANKFTKLNICDTFEIEYAENEAYMKYKFYNIEFSINDTISLDFLKYFTVDTINTVSSCIDGTHSIKNKELINKNIAATTIEDLPDKIYIKLNNMKIELSKNVDEIIYVSTGNGVKFGKKWGYSKNTISRRVTYSNIE